MKKILFSACFLIFYLTVYSQSSLSFIRNDSIKFRYGFRTPSLFDKHPVPSYYVIHVTINKEQRIAAKGVNRECWIRLLKDKSTDWAANLILYDLYQKDATDFRILDLKSRDDWVLEIRQRDISYWTKYLK